MLKNITSSRIHGEQDGENKVTLDLDVYLTLQGNVEYNKMPDIQLFDFYIFSDVIINKNLITNAWRNRIDFIFSFIFSNFIN